MCIFLGSRLKTLVFSTIILKTVQQLNAIFFLIFYQNNCRGVILVPKKNHCATKWLSSENQIENGIRKTRVRPVLCR